MGEMRTVSLEYYVELAVVYLSCLFGALAFCTTVVLTIHVVSILIFAFNLF